MKLEGLRLGKVWRSGRALVFEAGKKFLIARPGGFYLSGYAPRGKADAFSMFLRKRVTGKVTKAVTQHKLDRIVRLDLGDTSLVFELFAKGNVVYIEDGEVAGYLYSSKRFRKGEAYVPPESIDFLSLSGQDFTELVEGKTKAEVARLLGIGKLVEEVWGEPGAMLSALKEFAGKPLMPGDVEQRFKEKDLQALYDKEWERRSAQRTRLGKSIEELKQKTRSYEDEAARLEVAASTIMAHLPQYQLLVEEAFRKGKKRIKVSLSDI
jgi:predicted ribosome quality control (RQC) complex YloA/Tae2 family protein